MLFLGLDSSTAMASVCLADTGVLAEETSMNQRAHSEFLNSAIQKVLEQSSKKLEDIDYICVSRGPGSFTGLRVAGNVAKTLSFVFKKPIITADTLHLLSLQSTGKIPWVFCAINAYKNMVYYSLYNSGQLVMGPSVIPVLKLEALLDQQGVDRMEYLGDGYDSYKKVHSPSLEARIYRSTPSLDHPMARTLVEHAKTLAKFGQTLEWNLWTPLYIRASEAEENLRERQ